MSDQKVKLGELAPPDACRDAVHVAIVPVVAGASFKPGDPVALQDGKAVWWDGESPYIGIVDPFLVRNHVRVGERFWLCLRPGTVSNLRHSWAHPMFPPEDLEMVGQDVIQKAVSKSWMMAWCEERGADMHDFLRAMPTGQYCFNNTNNPYDWDGFSTAFWHHYKVLTGLERPDVEANFRCAC